MTRKFKSGPNRNLSMKIKSLTLLKLGFPGPKPYIPGGGFPKSQGMFLNAGGSAGVLMPTSRSTFVLGKMPVTVKTRSKYKSH